jgi:lipopolysaccharide heptosyltransferase II
VSESIPAISAEFPQISAPIVRARATRRAQVGIAIALKRSANLALDLLRRCLWPRARPGAVRRVCIYRIGNIGDTACAIPAMCAIRRAWPDAHLTLVTSPGRRGMPGARELLERADWLDEICAYYTDQIVGLRAKLKWIAAMRRRQFDLWIELPAAAAPLRTLVRNMLVARVCGARWGYGWRYERLRLFARAQSELIEFPDEVTRLERLLDAAGFTAAAPPVSALGIGRAQSSAIDGLLVRAAGCPLIVLAPGAKAEPNRWPPESFIEVGRHLAERGTAVALVGGAGDANLCAAIADAIGPRSLNLAGRTTLAQTCELLRRASLVVCNDSGVQHLAALVGMPCVSIFSCRDFDGKWYPHGDTHAVLRPSIACHTCFLDRCPYDNRCIKLVSAASVIAVVESKLQACAPVRAAAS